MEAQCIIHYLPTLHVEVMFLVLVFKRSTYSYKLSISDHSFSIKIVQRFSLQAYIHN